ncbi:hypothetical protein PC129_g14147 [Phytophthora cactorum]|uniref:Uncharacterized protein n=1 Tax=Phytophthora cactorum TaxID=29920 RepID=A0A8T1HRA5_9STRA|nr:hypothetical protein PC113_g16139 [Phytophthora cactorum]KAG2887725.1 hypothetical protein PC114_g18708 [Phytophthora cactorum]KAG2902145.1 hypothetical protein PC115_g15692 [Phytophthora cactorum]KAG3082766.1 hypothetical protein PC121_g5984 [Phytophthora cactorum]KAG3145850.1 hypothetical protein C6341_g18242 [Phytophthora cactorum]
MIAAQIGGDGKALDVQVPVRVYLTTNVEINSEDPVKQLEAVGRAEQILREDWRLYKLRNEQHEVPSGSIRCTSVLEPMVADFTDFQISSEFAEVMDKLMQSNVRALSMDISDAANPLTKMVGRLRVRLDNRFGHWNSGSFNPDTFAGDVNALVNMLATIVDDKVTKWIGKLPTPSTPRPSVFDALRADKNRWSYNY